MAEKTLPAFTQAYQQLNSDQKQAVDTIDGPVMVIAGPGTGKTQVLAARIANILLKTDTNPSSILALTFTESAAKNMRERLVSMIGKTAYYVQIHTFHSFCTDVINSHPEFFPIDRDSQPLSDLERFDMLQQLLFDGELEALKPLNTPFFYLKDILKGISDLKREGIGVSEFNAIVEAEQLMFDQEQDSLTKTERAKRQKQLAKHTELAQLYHQYELKLRASVRYDFDDMIALVVGAFETEAVLLSEYQERLLYFLVDEYQDTNSAQNKVVDLLASFWGEAANIFVVGDPNQAIYRFQGASLENVLSFTQRYSQATVITLKIGYRSPQIIYDAAAELITQNPAPPVAFELSQKLSSSRPDKEQIIYFKAPSQTLESVYVARRISQLLKDNVPASEIAILYRNNSDSAEFVTALEKWQIRFEIDGGNNVLEAEHISQLLCLFRSIHQIRQAEEDGLLFKVMQFEWIGLDLLLVMKVARAASQAKLSLFELLRRGYEVFMEHHKTTEVTALDFVPLTEFVERLVAWAARDAQVTFTAWFELVIHESGFLSWVMEQPDKIQLLNGVNSLFREVKAVSRGQRNFQLQDFLKIIETLETHTLSITLEDLNITQDAVHLSTVHKAKGREWSYVFLVKVIDGKWGNSKNKNLLPLPPGILKHTLVTEKERNEDDRRLFYVALTRAKKGLTITAPETLITDNRTREVMPSIFLEEIKTFVRLDASAIAQEVVTKADEHLAQLLTPVATRFQHSSERQFFAHLVKDFKLSVTALNTYLRSPDDFITQHLLKVPTAKTPTLAFGSAIHAALEYWFKAWVDRSEKLSSEALLTAFEESLTKEPLTSQEFAKRLKYGHSVLSRYYDELLRLEKPPLFVERFFGFGWSKTVLDDIHLTGRIDRVDWLDEGQRLVSVVDYKTGRPRTKGEIEATVASAELSDRERTLPDSLRGGYKRQLLFYKLLTELDRSFIPTVSEAVFEFIEPDKQSGKLVQRRFSLPDDEVEQLKDLIRQVMTEIRSLQFLDQA